MPRNFLAITHLAKMNSARRILIPLCLLPIVCLGGCTSINSHLATGMADGIPPADAPPRPGTAKYEEMMKERERERQTPKKDDATAQSSNTEGMGTIR